VMDIFAAAGLEKPDISILSEEFLAEVRGIPHVQGGVVHGGEFCPVAAP
jgi:Type I restriction enzyme HindI endonuclease subunit-like, C-terminal